MTALASALGLAGCLALTGCNAQTDSSAEPLNDPNEANSSLADDSSLQQQDVPQDSLPEDSGDVDSGSIGADAPLIEFEFTDRGWSYHVAITSLPQLSTEKVIENSPPGQAQLSQTLVGQFSADVQSLDEGRNAPPEFITASMDYPVDNPDLAIDLGYGRRCGLFNNAGTTEYECNTEAAEAASDPSRDMSEDAADGLIDSIFTEANMHYSISGGGCGLYFYPASGRVEETSGSKERSGCSSITQP